MRIWNVLKKYFGWRYNRSDDDIRSKLWLSHYYVNMSLGLKMGVKKLKYFLVWNRVRPFGKPGGTVPNKISQEYPRGSNLFQQALEPHRKNRDKTLSF